MECREGLKEFKEHTEKLTAANEIMRAEMAGLQEQLGAIDKLTAVNQKLQEKVNRLKAKFREANLSATDSNVVRLPRGPEESLQK